MRIVHFSDFHAGGGAEDWLAYLDKRWVGVFNYYFRRRNRFRLERLTRAVERILEMKPDLVICTGDLTSTGQPGEFEKVRPYLAPLRDSGIPLIYTPGNHDCYVRRPKCRRAVEEMALYLSHGKFPFDGRPRIIPFGGVNFITVNTSRPSNLLCSWGFLAPEDAAFVADACERLAGEGPRVLVNHYPIIEDHPLLRTRHRLFGERPVRRLIESGKLELSLCGHVHKMGLRVDAEGHGECCAGSLTANGAMWEILCDEAARRFTFHRIEI